MSPVFTFLCFGSTCFAFGFFLAARIGFKVTERWHSQAMQWRKIAEEFEVLALKGCELLNKSQAIIESQKTNNTPPAPFETI